MSPTVHQPYSLSLLAFKHTLQCGTPTNGYVTTRTRKHLWKQLLSVEPSYEWLKIFLRETKNLGNVLRFLFTNKCVEVNVWSEANALTKLYTLINKDITNLTTKQTLKFIVLYLYLNDLDKLFMPEKFAVFWCKSKSNLCKWCADVYVSSESNKYMTECCGNLKCLYYDHYDVRNFTNTVTDIDSYCHQCHRPLYTIMDVTNQRFPYNMYFCTLCD
nr:maco-A 121 [Mamestra configurata nucleopolyhedrovirus A]